jgi:membrane-bound ClpP family serine protease
MAVMMQARKAEGGPPPAALMALRPVFGKIGLAGIVLLWVSGLALWFMRYGFANLGAAYALKLVTATVLLGMILAMSQATAAWPATAPRRRPGCRSSAWPPPRSPSWR